MSARLNFWPFRASAAEPDAAPLLLALIEAARRPSFFGPGKAPDTLDGRLELIHLHGALLMLRLKGESRLEPLAQDFVDRLFRHLDSGLREAGVGDTSVPKRMRKIAGDFYGRAAAYEAALSRGDLAAAAGRNVLGDPSAPFAEKLAAYAIEASRSLAAAPADQLARASIWPPAPG